MDPDRHVAGWLQRTGKPMSLPTSRTAIKAIFASASILSATVAAADPAGGWMSDDQIRTAFAGVTIDGVYADGITFTESYANDGAIHYRDPRKAMTGRWSVVNRSFCTIYEGVITGGCFRVSRHSANCYEFHFLAGSETEAAAEDPGRPHWTARGWNRDLAPTCDEKPAV